jgi:polygalacturonase
MNEDGRRVGRPTENVVVRHITAHWCHGGIVIGSDMSGGVRNVLAQDCIFDGSNAGIRLKSNAARGGIVENIHYRDITMRNIKADAITLITDYSAWGKADNQTNYPVFRNITIRNVTCDGAARAAIVQATAHKPVENLMLENVSIKAKTGMKFDWVEGLKLRKVTSKPASGEPISIRNCASVDTEP